MSEQAVWAVVTGASRGIGAAVARRLFADGYRVALVSRAKDLMDEVREDIERAEGVASVHVCDLSDSSAVAALGEELVVSHDPVGVLVNNAGGVHVGVVTEQGGRHWEEVLQVNLTSAFELIRALKPSLSRVENASIVNIGSVMGVLASAGILSYAASKGGLHHMTRALAVELGPDGIRVNAVAPGFIRTDMFETSHPPVRQQLLGEAHPLGRVGTPEEVAGAVSFLCSHDAAFVSGAVLTVDGALTCKVAVPDLT